MRRLFYDIETSFSLFSGFQIGFNINVSYQNLIWESRVVCICYKWEGEDEVHSLKWHLGEDMAIISAFVRIADSADTIVGHNIDGFDTPILRTRAIKHGIPMGCLHTSEDTLKMAKRRAGKGFKFQSNRLDYIGQFLELGEKIHTDRSLWERVTYPVILPHLFPMTEDYDNAMDDMVTYCKQDVRLLEKVYHKLKPYAPAKVHEAVHADDHPWNCKSCGSGEIKRNGNKTSATGVKKQQWLCLKCNHQYTTSKRVSLDQMQWELDRKKSNGL